MFPMRQSVHFDTMGMIVIQVIQFTRLMIRELEQGLILAQGQGLAGHKVDKILGRQP